MLKICKWCGKEVNMRSDYDYCSSECRRESRRGKDLYFLDDISDNAKAYLIGLFLGDGNLSYTKKNHHVERMNLTLSDAELVDKVRLLMAPHRILQIQRAKKPTHSDSFSTETRNDQVIAFFKSYGLVHRKSKILKYPQQFDKENPYTKDFIRGYTDANGSYFKNVVSRHFYAHCSITTGSEDFALGLYKTINDFGITATKVTDSRRKSTFYIKIYGIADMKSFYKLCYQNEDYWVLKRKKEKLEWLLSQISMR